MKRGEVWTVAGSGLAGKPRPAVVVQDDRFSETSSVTVCLITSDLAETQQFRVHLEPSDANGLKKASRIMADKLMTISRSKFGALLGRLTSGQMAELERKVVVFLGLT